MGFTIVGGEMRAELSLSIEGCLPVSDEVVKRNIENASGLGLKTYRDTKAAANSKRLAVVGGGPSINQHKEEILAWDGDVWAINGAWKWLKDLGREATFLAVDPHPIVCNWVGGVSKAMLETRCDPAVFEMLKDADVTLFDIGDEAGQIRCGSSAVTVTPHLACRLGYYSVTLFGCESSYPMKATHAYMNESRPEEMLVLCGPDGHGHDAYYLTAPDFYMQAIELAKYTRLIPPGWLMEKSGGLLRAMIENDMEHHIVWVSDGLAKTLSPVDGGQVVAMDKVCRLPKQEMFS